MLTPEMIADGWLPHDGGPCPLESLTPVIIKVRGGEETRFETARSVVWEYGAMIWEICEPLPRSAEVVAYKPETRDADG